MVLKTSILILLLIFGQGVYADMGGVIAASTAQSILNTGVGVYMQNQGMQPTYIVTSSGSLVVPGAINMFEPVVKTQEPSYQDQNQQSSKQNFLNQYQ